MKRIILIICLALIVIAQSEPAVTPDEPVDATTEASQAETVDESMKWGNRLTFCAQEILLDFGYDTKYGVAYDECQGEGGCCRFNHQCATNCCEFDTCRGFGDDYDWEECAEGVYSPQTDMMTCDDGEKDGVAWTWLIVIAVVGVVIGVGLFCLAKHIRNKNDEIDE